MRTYYYYIRANEGAKKGERYGAICLLIDSNGDVARGISICSVKENFNKARGRGLALSRALSAMKDKCDSLDINRDIIYPVPARVFILSNSIMHKASFNPILTPYEKKKVAGKPKVTK